MNETFEIVSVEKPAWGIIGPAISEYNKQQAGAENGKSVCFVLQTHSEEIVGGVIGSTYWNWLHIDLMWVREDLRGQGYGKELLALAEDEARKRGAKSVFLDTFSFQAPDFYKKFGYQIFGQLDNFPTGHQRLFLVKQL